MKYLRKIFSPFLLILSITIFLYIFYKSEIQLLGSVRSYYIKYYIFTLILIIFSLISFYFKNLIKDYLITIFITLVVSSYGFEYYLIKSSLNNNSLNNNDQLNIKKTIYKKNTGKIWDSRSQYDVYRELLKTDKNTVPYFYPSELIVNGKKIHSLSGISNSKTVFCNENGYYSINKSDRYGFNNPDNQWESEEFEYVFIGDSFTHGFCVNRPNDIPSVIRNLSNKSVLNLGYGRNGPLLEYSTLREYLPKNTKKIIFMFFGSNDLENLNDELKNDILLNYIKDLNFSQNLKLIQNEIDIVQRKNVSIRSKGEKYKLLKLRKLRTLLKNVISSSKNENSEKKQYKLDKLEEILYLTKKLSIENNSKLYFVYLSSQRYFHNSITVDKFYSEKVKTIVEKLEIPFIDIHKLVFENEINPKIYFPFEMYAHYNVKGYRVIAETIFKLSN